jgi:hypothetical protein
MCNLFRRKPRIVPFNVYRPPEAMNKDEQEEKKILEKFRELTVENRLKITRTAKILSFKYHNGLLTSPRLDAGYEPPEKTPNTSGKYILYFIWDYL